MRRVSRVANTNASAFGPAPAAQVRNCRYARAYGSIEPEMSHSITSRRRAMRRRRRARRIGSPPVRRLARSVRRMSTRCAVARPLVAARAPQRRRELEARHQPVELRELVRLERVEALAPQHLLVARHRERHLDLGAVLVLAGADDDDAAAAGAESPACSTVGRSSGGVAAVCTSSGSNASPSSRCRRPRRTPRRRP